MPMQAINESAIKMKKKKARTTPLNVSIDTRSSFRVCIRWWSTFLSNYSISNRTPHNIYFGQNFTHFSLDELKVQIKSFSFHSSRRNFLKLFSKLQKKHHDEYWWNTRLIRMHTKVSGGRSVCHEFVSLATNALWTKPKDQLNYCCMCTIARVCRRDGWNPRPIDWIQH